MATETIETATLTTADGREFEIPTHWSNRNPERFHGLDADGVVVARDSGTNHKGEPYEILFTLTDCCGASFKGMDGGAGCRACYEYVGGSGMAWGDVSPFVKLIVT